MIKYANLFFFIIITLNEYGINNILAKNITKIIIYDTGVKCFFFNNN